MSHKPRLNCDIMFQKQKEYVNNDTRFTKVKIWLMHLGINHNGTSFSKESVEEAIPTLANIPILGYIEIDGEYKDFSGHISEVVFENDEKKYIYKGYAYGVIPEDNNARFEKRVCDDGIEREFLVVDGILWNKLSDGVDILNRDIWKHQSMELADGDGDYEGEYDSNYIFHFKKFKFYGACFLGDSYEPAMEGARIELVYSKIKNNIIQQLKNFNKIVKKEEGDKTMENKIDESENKKTQIEENKSFDNNIVEQENTINENSNNFVIQDGSIEKTNENKNSLEYEIELKAKDEEIQKLQLQLKAKDEQLEKITNEFSSYRERIETDSKNELIQQYADRLENNPEYKQLLSDGQLKEYSIDTVKEKLEAIIGRATLKFESYSKKEKDSAKYYFDNESNNGHGGQNSPFGSLVDNYIQKNKNY